MYHPNILEAWENGTLIKMDFYFDEGLHWRIRGLDYGFDIAELECVEGHLDGMRQCVSLSRLLDMLNEQKGS